jgi:hypothetical protein
VEEKGICMWALGVGRDEKVTVKRSDGEVKSM